MNSYIILFIIVILVINILSFYYMKWDKEFAINNKRRISEKSLFSFAFFMGATGIYLGMKKFRHKTKHLSFKLLIPVLIILNIIFFIYIIKFLYFLY